MNDSAYRVDGEIGRFEFAVQDVRDAAGAEVFAGRELLPRRQGRQWYQTDGFQELALFLGAAQSSYRHVQAQLNRWRRHEQDGTPVTTLRDGAERDGQAVLDFLGAKTQQIFAEHDFSNAGAPLAGSTTVGEVRRCRWAKQPTAVVTAALGRVHEQMANRGLDDAAQAAVAVQAETETFERAEQTVNVFVDEVSVKRQKAHRVPATAPAAEPQPAAAAEQPTAAPREGAPGSRPQVHHAVARIEQAERGLTLTAGSIVQVLLFSLAVLLNTGLIKQRLRFFTDGERGLKNAITRLFAWHKGASLLLDWFHLVKKAKTSLSLALNGRQVRNRHLQRLLPLLWFGLVDQAIAALQAIPSEDIKNQEALVKLVNSLERNRATIPCYALRRQLGLPNSSNPVERSNNLVTATRQKKKGMSWSIEGSQALTALKAVVCNGHVAQWVKQRVIPLQLAQAS